MNKIILFDHSNDAQMREFDLHRLSVTNSGHRLSKNYSAKDFAYNEQEIFSIGYKNSIPHLFSTVYRRDWWPTGTYRILNRLWKTSLDNLTNKDIDDIYIDMISAQISWLKTNRQDFQTAVISRNGSENRMLSMLAIKLNNANLDFKIYKNRVWVCKGTADACLQTILYHGNEETLTSWTC